AAAPRSRTQWCGCRWSRRCTGRRAGASAPSRRAGRLRAARLPVHAVLAPSLRDWHGSHRILNRFGPKASLPGRARRWHRWDMQAMPEATEAGATPTPARPRRFRQALVATFRGLMRLYFREIERIGEAPGAETRGRMFVSNHHNALIDPILVLTDAE